ncbi:hypothetical protein HTIA_2077 [Halorhabdus tiamatea SARL4B]|uniref:Uncharacterized protein n=1 Tax=Halorhabdus tiamatea SARL4B TaxID=1033806 RepID=S6D8W9_9EURY|nr:hypothetical protein HTIA_2077 [Halorhabdus tiamatea SARL4B]
MVAKEIRGRKEGDRAAGPPRRYGSAGRDSCRFQSGSSRHPTV